MSIMVFVRGIAIGALLLAAWLASMGAVLAAVMHIEWVMLAVIGAAFGIVGVEIAKARKGRS